jgi:hypothetical protein
VQPRALEARASCHRWDTFRARVGSLRDAWGMSTAGLDVDRLALAQARRRAPHVPRLSAPAGAARQHLVSPRLLRPRRSRHRMGERRARSGRRGRPALRPRRRSPVGGSRQHGARGPLQPAAAARSAPLERPDGPGRVRASQRCNRAPAPEATASRAMARELGVSVCSIGFPFRRPSRGRCGGALRSPCFECSSHADEHHHAQQPPSVPRLGLRLALRTVHGASRTDYQARLILAKSDVGRARVRLVTEDAAPKSGSQEVEKTGGRRHTSSRRAHRRRDHMGYIRTEAGCENRAVAAGIGPRCP